MTNVKWKVEGTVFPPHTCDWCCYVITAQFVIENRMALSSYLNWFELTQKVTLFYYICCKWFYLCSLAVFPGIFPHLSILSQTGKPSLTMSYSYLSHLILLSQFYMSFRSSSNSTSFMKHKVFPNVSGSHRSFFSDDYALVARGDHMSC